MALHVVRRHQYHQYRYRPNILIVGSERATETALRGVSTMFNGPTATRELPGPLQLPRTGCAAVILRNVGALNPEQQAELSRWLDSDPRVPVVSVSSSSIHALVAGGMFSERLYYRLNIILEDAEKALGTASWLVDGIEPERTGTHGQ